MELILSRELLAPDFTLGAIYGMGRRISYACEDAVRGGADPATVNEWKIPKRSAIPHGRYRLVNSFSTRFQKVLPELLSVPGFSGVRIHGGNTHHDTEGCILAGYNRTMNGVSNCATAVQEIIQMIDRAEERGEQCWITVEA